MAAREAHFATTKPMVERGQIVAGGAILDDHGKMIGSAMMVNFAERSEPGLPAIPTSSATSGAPSRSRPC
jgi:hypothetical protein